MAFEKTSDYENGKALGREMIKALKGRIFSLTTGLFIFSGCMNLDSNPRDWEYRSIRARQPGFEKELDSLLRDGWKVTGETYEAPNRKTWVRLKRLRLKPEQTQ